MPRSLFPRLPLLALWLVGGGLPAWSAMLTPPATNAPLTIDRMPFGSGEQSKAGEDIAQPVGNYGVWHVPQYLPGYPTSATIWPRAVIVKCRSQHCQGYVITPEMGPGEYLFFIPSEDEAGPASPPGNAATQ